MDQEKTAKACINSHCECCCGTQPVSGEVTLLEQRRDVWGRFLGVDNVAIFVSCPVILLHFLCLSWRPNGLERRIRSDPNYLCCVLLRLNTARYWHSLFLFTLKSSLKYPLNQPVIVNDGNLYRKHNIGHFPKDFVHSRFVPLWYFVWFWKGDDACFCAPINSSQTSLKSNFQIQTTSTSSSWKILFLWFISFLNMLNPTFYTRQAMVPCHQWRLLEIMSVVQSISCSSSILSHLLTSVQ